MAELLHNDGDKNKRRNSMDKKATAMLLLFLVFFGMEVALSNATVVSPPQHIQLEGGEEDNAGNWKGGYWTFTVSVDQADSLVGRITLPANTSSVKGEAGSEVKTKKTIEIQIAPKKAYYRRLLKLAPIEDRIVSPKVYKAGINKISGVGWYDKAVSIDPVVAEYYEWAEPSWQKYTTFDVSVYIEGQLLGTTTFNTETGTKDLTIDTTKGTMLIKNLGRLEGDYTEPQLPSEVVIFNEDYIFSDDAIQYIRFDHGRQVKYWGSDKSMLMYIENSRAYSTYWWGTVRWNPASTEAEVADSPAPFNNPQWYGYDIIAPEKGWKGCDGTWDYAREPVRPLIYPEEGDNSLIWYINKMCSSGNIADTWLTGYDWHIESKDDKPQAIVVDIPFGAYSGSPIVTFYIPTELAETFVYRPEIADVRIQNAVWLDGSEIDAAGKKKCQLELKQYARVTSSAAIYAETTTTRASVKPMSTVVTMAPNETKTVTFEVSNLGVDANANGTVMFTVKRSWDGVMTSFSQLSFKLIAPVLPDDYNKTDIIDRTGPPGGTDPVKVSEGSPIVLLVAVICVTVIAVILILVIARNKKYSDATKKIAKDGAKGTANLAKAVVRPFYNRNPGATTAFIMGGAIFFGLFLNMIWLPWIRIFPINFEIPFLWKCQSDWLWVIGIPLSFLAMIGGGLKILWSRTPPAIQQPIQIVVQEATKVATEGTKTLSDYFKKED